MSQQQGAAARYTVSSPGAGSQSLATLQGAPDLRQRTQPSSGPIGSAHHGMPGRAPARLQPLQPLQPVAGRAVRKVAPTHLPAPSSALLSGSDGAPANGTTALSTSAGSSSQGFSHGFSQGFSVIEEPEAAATTPATSVPAASVPTSDGLATSAQASLLVKHDAGSAKDEPCPPSGSASGRSASADAVAALFTPTARSSRGSTGTQSRESGSRGTTESQRQEDLYRKAISRLDSDRVRATVQLATASFKGTSTIA